MMKYLPNLSKSLAGLLLVGIGLLHTPSEAEILVPVIPTNQVDVTVTADVTFDAATQLYTYAYTVTSLPTSRQDIDSFYIEFNGEVLNVKSPRGWDDFPFSMQPIMSWAAIEVPTESIPPGYVDDGSLIPSPFQIKPGQTLGGFSLQSPSPPQAVKFYAKGFAQIPTATNEDDFNDITIPVFPDDSKAGVTLGPRRTDNLIFAGGRRPSVDGFLGFAGTQNGETRQLPVSILIRFAVNGETVFLDTFKAALNREDVTQRFIKTGNGSERVALFELGQSPIVLGRNV
ncbi:MAG: hypothetical protein KF682_22890, partial [Nitrospira sp.]|nr:hypothetical protein [Nitrospira sp.]